MEELKKYKFLNAVKQLPFVKEVWVFGSRARGDNEERSDIDIAVVCDSSATNKDWEKIINIIEDRDTLLHVDVVRFDTLKDGKFKDRILQEKKIWAQ